MKEKIIATERDHLGILIDEEIKQYGNACSLNHIDISKITDINSLFYHSEFNGDISKWNTSNVTNMMNLFCNSEFNGDISRWDVSKVTDISGLFYNSKFNRDISAWDVSNVKYMRCLFYNSKFKGDLSKWRPLKVKITENMFDGCTAPIPYWFGKDNEEIIDKIKSYDLFNKMNNELESKEIKIKKMKI